MENKENTFGYLTECRAIARIWIRFNKNDEEVFRVCKKIGWGSEERIRRLLRDAKSLSNK